MNYDARVKYIIHELKNNKQSWLLTESAIFGGKSHVISDKLQEAINWYESANAQVSQVSTFNFSAMCSQFGSVFLGAQLIALVEQPRMCTTTRQRLFKAIGASAENVRFGILWETRDDWEDTGDFETAACIWDSPISIARYDQFNDLF